MTGVIHAIPSLGQSKTPCCGMIIFDLPMSDSLTTNAESVTCLGWTKSTGKYSVTKNHDIEGKHIACDFFVLDLTHDENARKAAIIYAALNDGLELMEQLKGTIQRNTCICLESGPGCGSGWCTPSCPVCGPGGNDEK